MNIQMITQNQSNELALMGGQPTMASIEIATLTGKRHADVMRDIRAMLDGLEQNADLRSAYIQSSYIGSNGQRYPMYQLNQDLVFTLMLGYDVAARFKVIKRWQELERAPTMATPTDNSKITAELAIAEKAAHMLRLSDSGKLLMLSSITTNNGLDASFLPSYAVDAPSDSAAGSSEPTMSLTSLLKSHDISKGAAVYNKLLEKAGMIERLTRPKKGGGTQSYWNVTDKGLRYGKNVTNQYNQLETQPHWYIDRFEGLHTEVMSIAGGAA